MNSEWNQMVTVAQAYRLGTRFLEGYRVESPRFISELLLRVALGWDRTELFTRFHEPLPSEAAHRFITWLKKRAEGIPVQYLTGEQEFFGRSFRVEPSVLIPRPETEILVETVLREADNIWKGRSVTAADMGTGSGAIAVTLALERPDWGIVAVDRSPEALNVARQNGVKNGSGDRIRWLQGDWLDPLRKRDIRVDVLVSNPPYIPVGEIPHLDAEVREHEPRIALDGGRDGLDPYRILVRGIPAVLKNPGLVVFEVGENQSEIVGNMLEESLAGAQVSFVSDLAGRPRVVVARTDKR
ncbi:release factor glutamine methyltransferase [Kroppenstedtia guangzhouensis]|uniref:Release factor glutamine methyltransferase n=1 Tax=Kroppenstedtia guangzhouensis TaxID=1274356 RepID=A0ABQ1GL40_9BACL|nr:peptide chain release factor N(5)-glutamine methyltransferase [Kroppenstedtia guangzhouensis]GGA45952.1 release factor glutamine methyltransferase [Kroppenstedtia guangzhouensis]